MQIDKVFESVTQFFGQSAVAKLEHLNGGFGPDGYTLLYRAKQVNKSYKAGAS